MDINDLFYDGGGTIGMWFGWSILSIPSLILGFGNSLVHFLIALKNYKQTYILVKIRLETAKLFICKKVDTIEAIIIFIGNCLLKLLNSIKSKIIFYNSIILVFIKTIFIQVLLLIHRKLNRVMPSLK